MALTKVFIDGEAGTTGLRIRERLSNRTDIELIHLEDALRKDVSARKDALNSADIAFLCLPDAAAIEAVQLVENPGTVIIDTSTAHRVNDAWTYGFAELAGMREKIKSAKRIANPGCHASGFIALVAPLVQAGLLEPDVQLSCTSLTGYSGGGKKMIAQYEEGLSSKELEGGTLPQDKTLQAPRMYGLSQTHKHLPEMVKVCGLQTSPIFCPVVDSYYSGMETIIPVFSSQIIGTFAQVKECLKSYYAEAKLVKFAEACDEEGFLCANKLSGSDSMQLSVFGNEDRMLLTARFDNLGKGASGAAIQNMNIVMGACETAGLNVN